MTQNTPLGATCRDSALWYDFRLMSAARLCLLAGVGTAALLASAAPIGEALAQATINGGDHEIVDGAGVGVGDPVSTVGSPWAVGGDITVGSDGEGELTVRNGGKVISAAGSIGDQSGGEGSVTVAGTGSSWTNSNILLVGREGSGELTIENGATVSNTTGFIGWLPGGDGSVTVKGSGSTWNSQGLFIGAFGEGELTVSDGAEVISSSGSIGNQEGSNGRVTVTGADSKWTNSGSLSVGSSGGTGELMISDGGSVSSMMANIFGPDNDRSLVTVTGEGSVLETSGLFNVGATNAGELTVADGGRVVVSTPIRISVSSSSTGALNIGAAAGDPAVAPGVLDTPEVLFGGGAGTLVFNHTGANYNFAPTISGNGAITVHSGNTLLTADSSGFGGTTTVHGGRLSVIGSLGGDISIGTGGVLRGTGTVGNLDVSGILAPGNSVGTLSSTGDATFNAGSVFRVYVDHGGASRLNADGNAVINGGTVDVVSLEADDNQSILGAYTILEAASRTGAFDDVSANFAFIDPSLSYDDTRVLLTLALREVPDPDPDPGPGTGTPANPPMKQLQALSRPFAASANQQGLVAILDSLDTADPRYQAFFNTFVLLSPDEVEGLLEELSGSRSAGTSGISATFSTALMDFVQMANGFGGFGGRGGGQMASALTPGAIQFASAEPLAGNEWDEVANAPAVSARADGPTSWVRIVGQTGRQGGGNGMPGSDSRSAGLHAGIDMPVNDAFSVGAAIGYEQGRVTSGGMLGIDTESYSGAVYGRYQLDDLRLSGALSYSRIEYDSERLVPLFARQSAEYGANVWNVDAQGAYDFRPGPDGLTVSPVAGVRYIGMRQEGYRETGAVGLSVGSLTSDSLRVRLGAETQLETSMDNGTTVTLTARAAWSREVGSPETALRASLLGSESFAIQGQGLPRDLARLGLALDAGITSNVDLFVAYDGSLGDNYADHRGQAGLRLVW